MRTKRKIDDIDGIINKYLNEGMSISKIASFYHIGHRRISSILKNNDIEVTPGIKKVNIVGHKFGHLTAIRCEGEKHYKCGAKDKPWRCVCDCGREIVITQYSLLRGTSCGCEQRRLQALASTTHGGHNTKLYGVWCTMKNRCNNPNVPCYNHYGGRGITVCSEWLDFSKFMEWAFKNGYKEGLTIERVDVNGNYEPSNCKWIPSALQAKNKTNNRKLTYRGNVYILQDLANATGVDRRLISARVKRGWSVERAVEFPARKGYNGMNLSILNDNGTTD